MDDFSRKFELYKLLKEKTLRACREDSFIFTDYIFGYKSVLMHKSWHDFMNTHSHGVMLANRDSGKSQHMMGRILWEIGKNTNIRIKIATETDDLSGKLMSAISSVMLRNERYKDVFPNVVPAEGSWTKFAITIQRESTHLKDPTLEGAGMMTAVTGARADLVAFDDICGMRNTLYYPRLREQVKESFYSNWLNFLDGPEARWYLIGTPWHIEDLVSELRNNPNIPKCLLGTTKVITEEGPKNINWIVKHKWAGKVLSVQDDGSLCYKSVTGWHRNSLNDRKLLKLSYRNAKSNSSGTVGAVVTEDHPFLTKRGWIQAKDITDTDQVATGTPFSYNSRFKQFLLGSLLGDGCVTKHSQLIIGHSAKQKEYFDYKLSLLSGFLPKQYSYTSKLGTTLSLRVYIPYYLSDVRQLWYKPRKTYVEGAITALNSFGLAIWYMDDGGLANRDYVNLAIGKKSVKEAELMLKELSTKGFNFYKLKHGESWVLQLARKNECNEFFRRIAPYVIPSMRYKLPKRFRTIPFKEFMWNQVEVTTYWNNITTSFIKSLYKTVYCLSVEDTENFVTLAGTTHNCKEWWVGDNFETPWPERFPSEYFRQRLQLLKQKHFNRAYRGLAVTDEESWINANAVESCKDRNLKVYDVLQNKEFVKFTGVDLGHREGPKACPTVIFTVARTPSGKRIPCDIKIMHESNSLEIARAIINTWQEISPTEITVENNSAQQYLIDTVKSLGPTGIPVKGYHTGQQKADPNIGVPSLLAEIETGQWVIPFGSGGAHDETCRCPYCIWINEIKNYPYGSSDTVMASWLCLEGLRRIMERRSPLGGFSVWQF
jgi:hypothetical protein